MPRDDRLAAMIGYLKATPRVRDAVVSGGDVANLPWPRLEAFVADLLDVENIRDIRLASKAPMGLPHYRLGDDVLAGMERLGSRAQERGVSIAIHTHVNVAQSVALLVARAARAMLETGIRDVRNQGVLSREYAYYDPIDVLPERGQRWWRARGRAAAAGGLTRAPGA
jgi:L-lysine 2,3-aminomutase